MAAKRRAPKPKPSKRTDDDPKIAPMMVRPGARYTCFGDGLCCTDVHGLGPITKPELTQIRRIDLDGAGMDESFEDYMLHVAPDGGCHFLLPDQRCRVHAEHGEDKKPAGCRRFPVTLVATPAGGRVATEHRCPCRTMGDRPLISEESATPSLRGEDGEVYADREVEKVRLSKKRKVSFTHWRQLEAELLEQLAVGTPVEQVLGADPFPRLKGDDWETIATEFLQSNDRSSFYFALAWFGAAIQVLREDASARFPARPWAAAFDRAEARSPNARSEDEVFADWIADEIWSLKWADLLTFDVFQADLATRLAVARRIAQHLRDELGLRADRAAAEAVMIVELVGESEYWTDLAVRIRLSNA